MKVLFYNVGEFLDELRAEHVLHNISEGHIVRLTAISHRVGPEHSVTVVAGTLVSGKLVELRKLLGYVAGGFPDTAAAKKLEDLMSEIRTAIVEIGLTVRDGMYAPDDAR